MLPIEVCSFAYHLSLSLERGVLLFLPQFKKLEWVPVHVEKGRFPSLPTVPSIGVPVSYSSYLRIEGRQRLLRSQQTVPPITTMLDKVTTNSTSYHDDEITPMAWAVKIGEFCQCYYALTMDSILDYCVTCFVNNL